MQVRTEFVAESSFNFGPMKADSRHFLVCRASTRRQDVIVVREENIRDGKLCDG